MTDSEFSLMRALSLLRSAPPSPLSLALSLSLTPLDPAAGAEASRGEMLEEFEGT